MVYHVVGTHLTQEHAKHLIKGGTVQVHPRHLGGKHTLHLTKTQLGAMQTHHMKGKHYPLKLSKAQLKHTMLHGGSLFSLLKDIYNLPGVKTLTHHLGGKALDYVGSKIKKKLLGGKVHKVHSRPVRVKQIVNPLSQPDQLQGGSFALGGGAVVPHHSGKSFLGDIARFGVDKGLSLFGQGVKPKRRLGAKRKSHRK